MVHQEERAADTEEMTEAADTEETVEVEVGIEIPEVEVKEAIIEKDLETIPEMILVKTEADHTFLQVD